MIKEVQYLTKDYSKDCLREEAIEITKGHKSLYKKIMKVLREKDHKQSFGSPNKSRFLRQKTKTSPEEQRKEGAR